MALGFDLDKTLLNHFDGQIGGLNALLVDPRLRTQYGQCDRDALAVLWYEREKVHFKRYEKNELTTAQQREERLKDCFPDVCRQMSVPELADLYKVYLDGYERAWQLYPDVLPALKRLSAIAPPSEKFILITNGQVELQARKIDALGIRDFFGPILISEAFGPKKPDRSIFDEGARLLGVENKEVKFVGDDILNDVFGSFNAGMQAYWLDRHDEEPPAADVKHVRIRTLEELRWD